MSEVIEIPIGRSRAGAGARVSLEVCDAPVGRKPRVPVIARTLALAHTMQAMIDRGEVKDQAELARMLGFTRARITQMLDLTLLAPDIQDRLLAGASEDVKERTVRGLTRLPWRGQRMSWASLIAQGSRQRAAAPLA